MNLFDPVRNCFVPDLPEELVRQALILKMIHKLGYPQPFLAVEKELSSLPSLSFCPELLGRRADIICFRKDKAGRLCPLLLMECKATLQDKSAESQVIGYNYYVRAPFVAVSGAEGEKMLWPDKKTRSYRSVDFLPSYSELINSL